MSYTVLCYITRQVKKEMKPVDTGTNKGSNRIPDASRPFSKLWQTDGPTNRQTGGSLNFQYKRRNSINRSNNAWHQFIVFYFYQFNVLPSFEHATTDLIPFSLLPSFLSSLPPSLICSCRMERSHLQHNSDFLS